MRRALAAVTGAIDRYWFAPAPAARLAAVRILVGTFAVLYLAVRTPHILSYIGFPARQFDAIGVLWLLSSPPPGWAVAVVTAAAFLAGAGFTLGWHFRITGPLFAAAFLVVMTYASSWGQIFHTENLVVIYLLVLAVTRAADGYSLDARRSGPAQPPPGHGRYGWPLRLMAWTAVATYFIAGIAKIRSGASGWLGGEVLRDTVAADNLRKVVLGSSPSPLAAMLLDQVWLFRGLAILTLVVELSAPLALLGRVVARVWITSVLAFHIGVLALMAIFFPFPLSLVAFAPMLNAERFIEWVRARVGRLRDRLRRRRG